MRDFILWCCDVLVVRPAFLWVEIGGRVGVILYRKRLGHVYEFFSCWLHPVQSGVPNRRPRLYGFAWDRECVKFHGSEVEFRKLFTQACVLKGDTFIIKGNDARLAGAVRDAANRGFHHTPNQGDHVDTIPFSHRSPVLKCARFTDYLEQMKKKVAPFGPTLFCRH